jgi:hypothetical protein
MRVITRSIVSIVFSGLFIYGTTQAVRGIDKSDGETCCPIVELRLYTILPGKRDFLIDLFEKHFIESQEATGITIIAQFRVLDDPDRFFWLQGFPSMDARKRSFEAFYHGTSWLTYRKVANQAFLDTDNVLLLHPAYAGSGFRKPQKPRPPIGAVRSSKSIAVLTMYYLGSLQQQRFDELFESEIRPTLESDGADVIATLDTDDSPNTYPALPLRTDANVFLWISCFSDDAAYQRFEEVLSKDPRWETTRGHIALDNVFTAPEVWRLAPTPRSSVQC